jgi:hypothetical protein
MLPGARLRSPSADRRSITTFEAFNPAEIAQTIHEGPRDRLNRFGARHLGGGCNGEEEGHDRLPSSELLLAHNCGHVAVTPPRSVMKSRPPHVSSENTF